MSPHLTYSPATPASRCPYRLHDSDGKEIGPCNEFLDAQLLRNLSPRSLRSYAYDLLNFARCHGWGSHRVYFHDDAGRLRKIPACWTNVIATDPLVVVAAGRSAFRVADLLLLADLIEVLQPRGRDQRPANVPRQIRR